MHYNAGGKITTGHARRLFLNYLLRNPKPVKDTIAVWFPADMLKEALKSTDPNIEISGIRFYMGAYERDNNSWPKNPHYKEMVTLVCVQTREDNSTGMTIQRDILDDPDAPPEYGGLRKDFMGEYNDGQLCPPGTGCDEDGLPEFP